MHRPELEMINELLRSQNLASMPLEGQRAAVEAGTGPAPVDAVFEGVEANGVPCEWVMTPGVDVDGVVVSLRGGGYCVGSLRSNRLFSALLSRAVSARVLNVGYRSAPEHRYPAALDDAVAAYRWLVASGTPPARVAIAGNSAGGGLVLATLLALRGGGDVLPACAAAVSPWTDLAATGASIGTNAATDAMLDPEDLATTAALYADLDQLSDPYVSPLYGDPRGLPPTLIHVSGAEILLDDSRRFADRAQSLGVEVTLEVTENMPHVWHLFSGFLPEADVAWARLGAWISARIAV